MSVSCVSLLNTFCPPLSNSLLSSNKRNKLTFPPNSTSPSSFPALTCALNVGFDDIAALVQNKVLIAAGLSAAVGQLSKPFTGVLLYGRAFDIRATVQAGGFPSTHSSAVVATATCLALERGFSDSLFGLTIVYASLVMYDAQGVRREVGIHAKTINKLRQEQRMKSVMETCDEVTVDTIPGKSSSIDSDRACLGEEQTAVKEETIATQLLASKSQNSMTDGVLTRFNLQAEMGKESERTNSLLKESIGHTEIEVVAGAILGFLVSLTVYATM